MLLRQTDTSTEVLRLSLLWNVILALAFCLNTQKRNTTLTYCHCARREESCAMVLQAIPHIANRLANMNMSPGGVAPINRAQQQADSCAVNKNRLK